MAERRMFAKSIIDSDAFLTMPLTTQVLYFHLCMRADDDGFVNSPRTIQRMIGATEDDFKLLFAKRFLLPFDSGIIVIKHWRIHNYIQSDRYVETKYIEEKSMLGIKDNKAYTFLSENDECVPLEVGTGKKTKAIAIEAPVEKKEEPKETSEVVIELVLNDNSTYPITKEYVEELGELYPAVDVMQQFRNMKGWIDGNPTKRKTKRGIKKFINAWLSREQDRGGAKQRVGANGVKLASVEDHVLDSIF